MKHLMISIAMLFASVIAHAQGNEQLEKLFRQMDSLGIKPHIVYSNDGGHEKQVTAFNMIRFEPDANGKLALAPGETGLEVHQLICETLKGLTDNAKEAYLWEKHNQQMDSVKYSLKLGSDVTETLIYNYFMDKKPRTGPLEGVTTGFGHLYYLAAMDSTISNTEKIDVEDYKRYLQPILKQKGIEAQSIYLSHDTAYAHQLNEEDMAIYEIIDAPIQPTSETKGTIYSMRSKEQAENVLNQIIEATWRYFDEHPTCQYFICPTRGYSNMFNSPVMSSSEFGETYKSFAIHLLQFKDEYKIFFLDTKGELWLPKEIFVLQSWQNGKKKYNKRIKQMTEEEAKIDAFALKVRKQYTVRSIAKEGAVSSKTTTVDVNADFAK